MNQKIYSFQQSRRPSIEELLVKVMSKAHQSSNLKQLEADLTRREAAVSHREHAVQLREAAVLVKEKQIAGR